MTRKAFSLPAGLRFIEIEASHPTARQPRKSQRPFLREKSLQDNARLRTAIAEQLL